MTAPSGRTSDDARAGTPAGLPRSLVHIVDDDDADRKLVDAILRARGFTTQPWCSVGSFRSGLDMAQPGCVVIDLFCDGVDGPAMVRRLAELPCPLPAVALSHLGDTRQATAAMKAGAIDVLEKPAEPDTLCLAMEEAARCLLRWQRQASVTREARRRIALLSPREREVLAGLIAGASNKVMAQDLSISARTVEIHRARVMAKLQAGSLAQLIRIALAAEATAPWQVHPIGTFVGH